MPELKVVVATNLTGKGHEQRKRGFLNHLKNEAEISELHFVGSGRPPGKTLTPENTPDREYPGITWKYGARGIDFFHAAGQLLRLPALRQNRFEFAKFLREYQPDGIWSDFEFVACGGAEKYKTARRLDEKPVFTQRVDHHSAFLSRHVPRPPQAIRNIPTDWFLQTFCKADQYEGFHFKKYEPGRPDLNIHTPVIQPEIRDRVKQGLVRQGEHVMVYLPGYDLSTIEDLLRPHTDFPWIIYHGDVSKTHSPLPHVTFKPTGFNEAYLDDLTTCFAAVITTGFQLPSELLYLRKYFVGTIQRGQPEQGYNAAALVDIGVPVFSRLNTNTMARTVHLLKYEHERLAQICAEDMEQVYPDTTKEIVQEFVRRCADTQFRQRTLSLPSLSEDSFAPQAIIQATTQQGNVASFRA